MVSGMSVSMAPLTNAIMSGVPRHRAGVGSAMNDTTRELGGALGVAVLGSILTSQYGSSIGGAVSGLPASAQVAAETSLAGALQTAGGMGQAGAALADAARQAFVDGMGVAFLVGAAVIAVAAIVARKLLPAEIDEADHAPVLEPDFDVAIDAA